MLAPSDDRFACDASFPGRQVLRLVAAAIDRLRLDLTGLNVLTEAGVGYRRIAPSLAALAGAEAVYAVVRDSAHMSRKDAEAQTAWFAELARVANRVHIVTTRLQAPLAEIGVVTDLPGVRPVDESLVRSLPETAVVTLMRGTGQWRAADVDVATCRRSHVAVAGVDEEAAGLLGSTAMEVARHLLSLGVEIAGATVVVAGAGRACAHVVRGLCDAGAAVLVAAPENAGRLALLGGRKIGDALTDESVLGRLAEADALVLCPASREDRMVGPGAVDAARLAEAAPHLAVVCLASETDRRALASAGLRCRPGGDGETALDVFPRALVELYTAGLKVGEVMARARRRGSSPRAAEQLAEAEAHAELLPQDLAPRR